MLKTTLVLLAILLLLGLVGLMDYEDEVLEVDLYCAQVHSGQWPDYRGTYHDECKDGQFVRRD